MIFVTIISPLSSILVRTRSFHSSNTILECVVPLHFLQKINDKAVYKLDEA